MFTPRGSIVRSARLRAEDGDAVLTLSAPAVLVTCHANAESRRSLRRAAAAAGVILEEVEGDAYGERDGTFNRRTGRRQRDECVLPNSFRAVGPVEGLEAVCSAPCVKAWEFLVSVRVPVACGGSGTLSAGAERRVRDARREAGERAAERERAERRPFVPRDPHDVAVGMLAPDADAPTQALVAELVRLAERAAELTDGERARVTYLRRLLGV